MKLKSIEKRVSRTIEKRVSRTIEKRVFRTIEKRVFRAIEKRVSRNAAKRVYRAVLDSIALNTIKSIQMPMVTLAVLIPYIIMLIRISSQWTQAQVHKKIVATLILASILQSRSDTTHEPTQRESRSESRSANNTLTSFIFMGTPRSGNNKNTVKFSDATEHLIATAGSIFMNLLVADSGAGCSIVSNEKLLSNIRPAPNNETMRMHCNSGTIQTDLIGDLDGYGTVWFNPQGIANIISLGEASARHRITMDNTLDNAIFIHKSDGTARRFGCMKSGIYCCDLKSSNSFVFNGIVSVESQEQQYSALDVNRAKAARKLQETMGFISERDLLQIVDNNLIRDSKVRRRDVLTAGDIYGKNTNVLKGKTTRRTPPQVREDAYMDVPRFILDRYSKSVTLCADVMHVNGVPFFIAISKHIKHISLVPGSNMNKATMLASTNKVISAYHQRGFTVTNMQMDNAFETLRDDLNSQHQVTLNTVAASEHEPTIERCIRHVKERCRCAYAGLPFKHLPKKLGAELVNAMVYWINSVPRQDGVHPVLSPRTIMTGQQLTTKHVKFQFGDSIEATQPSKTQTTGNTMDERTSDAIYCFPSGSTQGGYWVYKLATNQVVHRNQATLVHTSDTIIQRVEDIAHKESAPEGLVFGDRNNNTTILEYEEEDALEEAFDEDYDDTKEKELENDHEMDEEFFHDAVEHEEELPEMEANDEDDVTNASEMEEHRGPDPAENEELEEDHESDSESVSSSESTGGAPRRSTRPSLMPPRYPATERVVHNHVYFQAVEEYHDSHAGTLHQVFQDPGQYHNIEATLSSKQYGLKAGLKVFKSKGLAAVSSEIEDNLHGRGVIEPVPANKVTGMIRKASLPYLMFLKQKRCGKIKARGCADGRKQREFISKEEASSPTVSTHALMATCLIDAIEGRCVATADIPGAFLQADMDEDVWIMFEGEMVDILVSIDEDLYGPCVSRYRSKRFLHAKAKKAIYGCLRSALLFYQLFTGELKEWGFKMNPYDSCTFNKMVMGSQITIVFHVDDCKISHLKESVVEDLLEKLSNRFGREKPLSVTRGAIHDYLGLTIDYSVKGKVKFYMFDYIEQILNEIDPTLMKGTSATPAATNLFKVSEGAIKLSSEVGDQFHRSVAQLLFLSKRARPDFQTTVAFLCTRVKSPDIDDLKKLGRAMRHLRATIFLPLCLGWDGTGNIYWSVDASFGVHPDMKSHTGGVMSLGKGAVMAMSTKQKLNTTSSTEAELVGVSDSLAFNMWCTYFFKAQGQAIGDGNVTIGGRNILYQDNESCIKLANNGKASSTKRTRHIHIRYFAITDRVAKKEIEIHYCPTEDMLGDFYTKPVQGSLYRKFRNNILGITEAEYLQYESDYNNAKRSAISRSDISPVA